MHGLACSLSAKATGSMGSASLARNPNTSRVTVDRISGRGVLLPLVTLLPFRLRATRNRSLRQLG